MHKINTEIVDIICIVSEFYDRIFAGVAVTLNQGFLPEWCLHNLLESGPRVAFGISVCPLFKLGKTLIEFRGTHSLV
jgi:hypothetical protein